MTTILILKMKYVNGSSIFLKLAQDMYAENYEE